MTRKSSLIRIIAVAALLVFTILLNSCITAGGAKTKPDPKLTAQYLEKAREFESMGDLVSALEQYKLALTVDPQNAQGIEGRDRLSQKLSKMADERYNLGMKYHRQGKYGLARKEFLTALKYQPDHPRASKMLVSRKPQKAAEYTIHTVQKGESLSIIAKNYYGDFRKFDVIARYNNIKDATKVRPGQTLRIPTLAGMAAPAAPAGIDAKPTGFVWHTIEPGQSISRLAQLYYGDFKQFHLIARYNGMEDATRVKVGDRVKIPKIPGLPFNEPSMTVAAKTDTAATQDATAQPEPMAPEPKEESYPYQPDTIPEVTPEPTEEPRTEIAVPAPEGTPVAERDEQALAYRDAGIELYNDGNYEDAIFELNKAVEAVPNDNSTRSYLAKAYFESGLALFNQQDFAASREAFESALQYDAQCAQCPEYIEKSKSGPATMLRAKGIEYVNGNQFENAIVEFEQYLQIRPEDAEVRQFISKAHFQKALIDYNKGDFMTATKGFGAALAYDADCQKCTAYIAQSEESFKDTHYNKGMGYFGNQQLAEAIDEWEQVYNLDPGYKDVEQNLNKAKDLMEKLEKIKKSQKP
jgi:tetratricopeptide (TPR) repeat protein